MSDSFDFGKASEGVLKRKVGDKLYSYAVDSGGSLTIKVGDEVLKDADALKMAAKEFAGAAKSASASAVEDEGMIRKVYDVLKSTHAEELKPVKGLFDAAEGIEGALSRVSAGAVADESTLAVIRKHLVAHPEAKNVLSADAHNLLTLNEVEKVVDGVTKKVRVVDFAKLDGEVSKLRGVVSELVSLHEAGGYDEKAVKKILARAPEGIADVMPVDVVTSFNKGITGVKGKANVGPVNISTLLTDLQTEVTAARSEATAIGQRMVKLNEEIQSSWIKPGLQKKLEAEGKKLATLLEEHPDIHHHINTAMEKEFTAEQRTMMRGVKSASSAMSSLSQAASSGGKEGPGIFKRTFTWTEEALSKAKDGAKGNSDKLKKLGDIKVGSWRGSRVVMGAAAVTAAVVAGMSFFGHDKEKSYVEAENQRRASQGQAAGIGA